MVNRLDPQQLRGKIWIADFIFTTCPGPCPMISSRMSELQKPLEKTDVHLVSFSVDPEHDTPEVLRGYAETIERAAGTLGFSNRSEDRDLRYLANGFKLGVADEVTKTGTPVHSTRMVLVDRRGRNPRLLRSDRAGCDNQSYSPIPAIFCANNRSS